MLLMARASARARGVRRTPIFGLVLLWAGCASVGAPGGASPGTSACVPSDAVEPREAPVGAGDGAPVAASLDHRWAVMREAREDTDGDGRVHVGWYSNGHTAELVGDELGTYLVRGVGPGRRIDELVGSSADGRYLYFVEGGALIGLDASEDRSEVIGAAPTPLPFLAHGALWSGYDAASVGPRGRLAFTPDRHTLRVWEPETRRASEPIPVEGFISRVRFVGDWVVADILADRAAERTLAELPHQEASSILYSCGGLRRCQGPPRSLLLLHPASGVAERVAAGRGWAREWGLVLGERVLGDRESLRIVETRGVSTVQLGSGRCEVRFIGLRSAWILLSCGDATADRTDADAPARSLAVARPVGANGTRAWTPEPLTDASLDGHLAALDPMDRLLLEETDPRGWSRRGVDTIEAGGDGEGFWAQLVWADRALSWDAGLGDWRTIPRDRPAGCLRPSEVGGGGLRRTVSERCVRAHVRDTFLLASDGSALVRRAVPGPCGERDARRWFWGRVPVEPLQPSRTREEPPGARGARFRNPRSPHYDAASANANDSRGQEVNVARRQ